MRCCILGPATAINFFASGKQSAGLFLREAKCRPEWFIRYKTNRLSIALRKKAPCCYWPCSDNDPPGVSIIAFAHLAAYSGLDKLR
jgi:hypothetical protein